VLPSKLFNLRTQQLLTLLLAGSIPLILLLVFGGHLIEQRAKSQALERMHGVLTIAAQQVREKSNRQMEEIRAVSSPQLLSGENGRTAAEMIEQIREVYGLFNRGDSMFALLDLQGLPIGSSQNNHIQHGLTSAFHDAAAGRPAASSVHMDRSTRELVTGLYHPLRFRDGSVQNVVRHYVPIKLLAPNLEVEGRILWLNEDMEVLSAGDIPALDDIRDHFTGLGPEGRSGLCVSSVSDKAHLFVRTTLDDDAILNGSHLVYILPKRTALATVSEFRRMALQAGAVSFALLTLISLFASARLSRPIQAAARSPRGIWISPCRPRDRWSCNNYPVPSTRCPMRCASAANFWRKASPNERANSPKSAPTTIDGFDNALVVFNADATETRFVNKAARNWFGLDTKHSVERWMNELSGWFADVRQWEEFKETARNSEIAASKQFPVVHSSCEVLDITSAPVHGTLGNTIGRLWLFRDVSEQERLESELRQSQKVEAVGRLAGGLAHDFNNILTAIQGGLELMEIDIESGLDPSESLEMSLTGCDRAAGVVQQLLSFSRQRPLELKTILLKDIVKDTVTLVRPSIDRLINIGVDVPNQAIAFAGDRVQIEQVLMNLVINASHAMPDGGEINIRCYKTELAQADPLDPGSYAGTFSCMEVTDTGHGMTEEVRQKIFDPFFTTKPQGKGTGLGLPTSLGIIQRHKGWIRCKTAVGKGTSFTVILPAAEVEEEQAPAKQPIPIQAAIRGSILLVDDEAAIRKIARLALKKSTHEIEEAADGMEALERMEQGSFDLVILDLTMPRLSGAETLRQIKERWPDTPVLIWSGHSEDAPALFESQHAAPDGFLVKPFRRQELIQTVGKLLRDAKKGDAVNTKREQA